MATYTTATGVTYTVTPAFLSNTVTITDPSGNTIYSGSISALNGAVMTPSSSSTISVLSLLVGGTYVVTPGVNNGTITIGASILNLTGNHFYIGGTATINVLASALGSMDIHVDGGNLTLTSGGILSAASNNTIEISYGGSLLITPTILSALSQTTINFGSGGGTFVANSGGSVINLSGLTINNYDPKLDVIELINTTDPISGYVISGSGNSRTIALIDNSGQNVSTFTVNIASGVVLPPGTYSVNNPLNNPLSITYSNGNTYIGACFLAGSMIRTPTGDVPVEDIQINDSIITYVDGKEEIRTVIWAGWKEVNVRPDYPDDEAGYPIRILKNAIADNVPYKDMLITAEHCLFLNGKFIPARMLVNNISIFYDYSISSYTYYHIETEKHSVIVADGMLTESYLDTGNRFAFQQTNNNASVSIYNRHLTWEQDAAAPLEVTRAFVEPIFYSIFSRKENTLGKNGIDSSYKTTTDSNFHLITNTGIILYPTSTKDHFYSFSLPDHVTSVRLVSRSSRPFDIIGPFVNDRRYLGLLVGKVLLQHFQKIDEVSKHFEERNLDGWYHVDSNGYRWTDGNALLPLDNFTIAKNDYLIIQVESAGPYIEYENKNKNFA